MPWKADKRCKNVGAIHESPVKPKKQPQHRINGAAVNIMRNQEFSVLIAQHGIAIDLGYRAIRESALR